MKLLAFDTATEACTAALWLDGKIVERFESATRHAERLLPMIEQLLAEAGLALTALDAVAFGRGPGSFTGLRIGAGVAQGIAFGADLPVVPISSLAALAQTVDAPKVLAALDARMGQVYWCSYLRDQAGLVDAVGAECVVAPGDIPLPLGNGWTGVGPGWGAYDVQLRERIGAGLSHSLPEIFPHASAVAALAVRDFAAGKAVAPELALPVYIRDEVAVKQKGN
ncbi:MAG: tRNA (adenosine(37)-N6)-threonylcarbamoyltransferase complex dimerization subunit type 1 TsaB [Gammaproteobacteria bacterium]|nr:tRNA (adenosine(37)-N6)-threonylcarbamoyltransferase complex dimerization subunit type 1 TsaB [Gammaproteobacteria bacterium]